jgi:hypothetical protein
MGVLRNAYILSAGKSESYTPPGRPKHRWEDYNEIDLIGNKEPG